MMLGFQVWFIVGYWAFFDDFTWWLLVPICFWPALLAIPAAWHAFWDWRDVRRGMRRYKREYGL